MTNILTQALNQSKLLDRFTRLEYLFGVCITLPFVGILGISILLYQENKKLLRQCEKIEDKIQIFHQDMMHKKLDDESTVNEYAVLSKSSSLSSLSEKLSLLYPESVPQVCSRELLALDNMGIQRSSVASPGKIKKPTSSELLQDYDIIIH